MIPYLSLSQTVQAAWTAYNWGYLSNRPKVCQERKPYFSPYHLVQKGGADAWLRMALTDEQAEFLKDHNCLNWPLVSLMGETNLTAGERSKVIVQTNPDESADILFTSAMVTQSQWSTLSSFIRSAHRWRLDQQEPWRGSSKALSFAKELEQEGKGEQKIAFLLPILFDFLAQLAGCNLNNQPNPRIWSNRRIVAKVASTFSGKIGIPGFQSYEPENVCFVWDGGTTTVYRDKQEHNSHYFPDARIGQEYILKFQGATPEHGGYLSSIESVETHDSNRWVKNYLKQCKTNA